MKKNKSEKLFDSIKEKYEKAYLASNGRPVTSLTYKKGYVHVLTDSTSESKYRVHKFVEMLEELERRILIALIREEDNTQTSE